MSKPEGESNLNKAAENFKNALSSKRQEFSHKERITKVAEDLLTVGMNFMTNENSEICVFYKSLDTINYHKGSHYMGIKLYDETKFFCANIGEICAKMNEIAKDRGLENDLSITPTSYSIIMQMNV
jgi:hypothetical protein